MSFQVRRVQGEVGRMVGEGSTLITEFSEKRFFSVWTHMCLMPTQNHLRGLEQRSATYVLVLLEPWRRQKLETGGCLLLELQGLHSVSSIQKITHQETIHSLIP